MRSTAATSSIDISGSSVRVPPAPSSSSAMGCQAKQRAGSIFYKIDSWLQDIDPVCGGVQGNRLRGRVIAGARSLGASDLLVEEVGLAEAVVEEVDVGLEREAGVVVAEPL